MNVVADLESSRSSREGDDALMRGVLRTLNVLRALNVRNGATVVQLSRMTGISRSALYRMLETLRDAGYVSVDLSGRHYCLTMMVRSLAEGFNEEDWITDIARPALRRAQKELLWPVDLGTFMDNAMWIRESTRKFSALTIDRCVVGARFPVLATAGGRCFLAHCGATEREKIIQTLVAAGEQGTDLLKNRRTFDRMLDEIRENGFALRLAEPPLETGAVAVPILLKEQILGIVVLTFIRRALTSETVIQTWLPTLIQTAADIAAGMQASPQI